MTGLGSSYYIFLDFINRNEMCGQEIKFSKGLNIGSGKYIYVVAIKVVENLFQIQCALLRICPILIHIRA